jgi:formate dehydrogenase assembly factor FdhD
MADSNFPDDVNVVPAEDGTTWVEIASTGTEDEARLLQGFLEAEGIVAQIENVKFSMEPINFGTMGDIRVYVGADDERRAQELLRAREREYEQLNDDEETLVTDEGPALVDETAQTEGDDGAGS